ncbi:MAG: hypothetical protein ACD_46C00429G0009 [uncultured bacterium]|nr:MAG: hypothetical protein ACD_46C00429G0009 [uncultured bacterium]
MNSLIKNALKTVEQTDVELAKENSVNISEKMISTQYVVRC